jgi:hypothetical protein
LITNNLLKLSHSPKNFPEGIFTPWLTRLPHTIPEIPLNPSGTDEIPAIKKGRIPSIQQLIADSQHSSSSGIPFESTPW